MSDAKTRGPSAWLPCASCVDVCVHGVCGPYNPRFRKPGLSRPSWPDGCLGMGLPGHAPQTHGEGVRPGLGTVGRVLLKDGFAGPRLQGPVLVSPDLAECRGSGNSQAGRRVVQHLGWWQDWSGRLVSRGPWLRVPVGGQGGACWSRAPGKGSDDGAATLAALTAVCAKLVGVRGGILRSSDQQGRLWSDAGKAMQTGAQSRTGNRSLAERAAALRPGRGPPGLPSWRGLRGAAHPRVSRSLSLNGSVLVGKA